jgi:hypothetical protein
MCPAWVKSFGLLSLLVLLSGAVSLGDCPTGCQYVKFTKTDLKPPSGPIGSDTVTVTFKAIEADSRRVAYTAYYELFEIDESGWPVPVDVEKIEIFGEPVPSGSCWTRTVEIRWIDVPLGPGLNDFQVGAAAHADNPGVIPPVIDAYWSLTYDRRRCTSP